ncbi:MULTISPECIES: DUF4232 domain-containing protein [unclassified Streptomyces]|uniref:DUF4232 domain-containing protein n=1 Tax=unclassified Streptomyces TaxID=2593676 RepID=UPI001BE6B84E|nr:MULTISPECIES: DUF4232 domain-containing protein [unclassified Streptomyces]MBT2408935.1 DUF4232 domain-containing protein [Streptomyces sp. ISL-21]MBT2613521.1 DUF4232 domain-containing protein [Streptomyces sp. ISL-87]
MQYSAGVGRTAAAVAAAVAVTALMTGCTPTGDDGAGAKPSAPSALSATATPPSKTPAASEPAKPTPTGGADHTKPSPPEPGPGGGAKACAMDQIKVSDAHQADVRPSGTGTGAAVVSVTNTSKTRCTLSGFPTVAGAGNGSPDHNLPLATTHSGSATTVSLAAGARAWTKLTFVNVQGEADGYCVSGATPASFPTLVLGVPGAGSHQIAMDDGVFAECDNKVTVIAFSATKPS